MTERLWTAAAGDWFEAGNWSPAGVPTGGDVLSVVSGAPAMSDAIVVGETIRLLGPVTLTVHEATFASGAAGPMILAVRGDDTLPVTATLAIRGAAEVVHHATVFVIPPVGGELPPDPGYATPCGKAPPPTARKGPGARDYLFSWSPGSLPFLAPTGSGRVLPKGARLLFELHYTTVGKPVSDRTRIALRFAKAPQRARVTTIVAQNRDIVIPPNAADYRVSIADLDRNGDGVLRRDEVPESHALSSEFKLVDGNHDGRITAEELAAWR